MAGSYKSQNIVIMITKRRAFILWIIMIPHLRNSDDIMYLHSSNKVYHGEKAWCKLHKNTMCVFEQTLEVLPHKTATVQTLTFISQILQVRQTGHGGHGIVGKSRENSCDILLWNPTHGCTSVDWPVKSYVYQFYANTGCILKDLPRMMDDRDRW